MIYRDVVVVVKKKFSPLCFQEQCQVSSVHVKSIVSKGKVPNLPFDVPDIALHALTFSPDLDLLWTRPAPRLVDLNNC